MLKIVKLLNNLLASIKVAEKNVKSGSILGKKLSKSNFFFGKNRVFRLSLKNRKIFKICLSPKIFFLIWPNYWLI